MSIVNINTSPSKLQELYDGFASSGFSDRLIIPDKAILKQPRDYGDEDVIILSHSAEKSYEISFVIAEQLWVSMVVKSKFRLPKDRYAELSKFIMKANSECGFGQFSMKKDPVKPSVMRIFYKLDLLLFSSPMTEEHAINLLAMGLCRMDFMRCLKRLARGNESAERVWRDEQKSAALDRIH